MAKKPARRVNPFAKCESGTDTGEYILDDGQPRVWDGSKWLSPKDALEASVIDLGEIGQPVSDADLGHLKNYGDDHHLWKIPGWFVLNLSDWRYSRDWEGPKFYEELPKAKEAFWEAVREAIETQEMDPSDFGRKVHSRSVYSEDGCGGNWETATVYDCPGFAVIDYGSFPCTCGVPRFEIHDDVDEAKSTLESFVDELECNAQGNIEYKWRATVWNEGEEEVEYGASWQDDEEEEEVDSDEDEDDQDEDDESDAAEDESEEDDDLTPEAK
jgi:hypothetical protein